MAQEEASRNELEVLHRKEGTRVRLLLDPDAVARCLERDGTLTVRFQEVGSTSLADLVQAEVIVN